MTDINPFFVNRTNSNPIYDATWRSNTKSINDYPGYGNYKEFQVPADEEWILQSVRVIYNPSSVTGSRYFFLSFPHFDDVISSPMAMTTGSHFINYGLGADSQENWNAEVVGIYKANIRRTLPEIVLAPGHWVLAYDPGFLDDDDDTFDLNIYYIWRKVYER